MKLAKSEVFGVKLGLSFVFYLVISSFVFILSLLPICGIVGALKFAMQWKHALVIFSLFGAIFTLNDPMNSFAFYRRSLSVTIPLAIPVFMGYLMTLPENQGNIDITFSPYSEIVGYFIGYYACRFMLRELEDIACGLLTKTKGKIP